MIRAAKFGDIPRLTQLLCEMHGRSIYRDTCAIDVPEAKAMLMRAIQRHGGTHDGSTFVQVAVRHEPEYLLDNWVVEGFIIACLSRLYGIGDKLMAADTHFYVSPRAHARDAFKLIDAYKAWAVANENVIDIHLCAIDGVGQAERTEKLYKRRGFKPFGVVMSIHIEECAHVQSI